MEVTSLQATFIVLSLTIVLLCVWSARRKRSKILSLVQSGKYAVLNLLPEERNRHVKVTPPISTLTFYKGEFPVQVLRERVEEILQANPFLRCRLVNVTTCDVASANNRLLHVPGPTAVYPTKTRVTDLDDYFKFEQNGSISADMPYEQLIQQAQAYSVAMGKDCLDKNIPLFKVTLIEIAKGAYYCMMVSLCHTIADGHTFYKIYAMLNPTTPVTSIATERVVQFSVDTKDNLNFGLSPRELPFTICGTLRNRFLQPRFEARTFFVSPEAVKAEKERFTAQPTTTDHVDAVSQTTEVPFLSTNDVLTSWFLRFSRVSMAFMIANFRGRLPYLADSLGGNYQGRILFASPEMRQPATIRKSLSGFKCPHGSAPSLLQIAEMDIALVTNWASFYSDVRFPGVEQQVHLPVIDVSGAALRQCMVIFQAQKGVTGVILWTRGIPAARFESEILLQPTVF